MKTTLRSDLVFEISCVYKVSPSDDISADMSIIAEPRGEPFSNRRQPIYLSGDDVAGPFSEGLGTSERDFVTQVLMAPSHEILARLARISVGVAACLRTRTPVSVWVWALLDPDRNSVLTNSGGQLWQDHPSKESYRWDRSGGTVLPSAGQEPALTVFFLAQDGLASISPHTLEGLFTEARDQFAQSNQGPLRLFAGARDV